MPQVIGVRDTRQSITAENTLVRMVGDDITLLEPNVTPLITMTTKLGQKKPAYSPRIEWLEDDYVARWAQADVTTVGTTGTTIAVLDGTLFVVGDLFVVPRLVSVSTPPEQVRVSGIATNTLTIVRGANAASIGASAALRIIGSAAEEGAAAPEAKSTTKVTKTTFTQIMRTKMKISKTNAATKQYGAPNGDRKNEQKKKLAEHKIKMNSQALWGAASESLTGGPSGFPIRTTPGINSIITTNVVDAGGTLTDKMLETFARTAFRYGKDQKLLLCSALIKSAINDFAKRYLNVKPMEEVLGVKVQRVETAHGTWLVARDWMLENGIAGGNGFGGMALSIDMDECTYFYLSENGINRDTQLLEDISKTGADAFEDEYLTEGAFRFKFEKKHAKLFNVVDYSA
jgi:hypothetical protein